MNTNIDSYSINELKDIFDVKNNFNMGILEDNYNYKLRQIQELDDAESKEKLSIFFNKAYKLLVLYYRGDSNNNKLVEKINILEDKLNILEKENKINKDYIYNVFSSNESNIKVNSITHNTVKKQLAVSSRFRKETPNENSDACNFIIELPETINNVTSLEIVNSEIPTLSYTFSDTKDNNKFKIHIIINENDKKIDEEYTITIPNGLWFATDLEEYLNDNYFDNLDYINTNSTNTTTFADGSSNELSVDFLYLRYMKFVIPTWNPKPVFRFKTSEELATFKAALTPSGVLDKGIKSIILDPLNTADPHEIQFSLSNVISESLCINNEKTINIYKEDTSNETNFSLSCLGTFGFTIKNIYNNSTYININNREDDYKYIDNNNIYYGYLQASHIYGHSNPTSYYISVNDFVGNQSQQILILGNDGTLISDNVLSRVQIVNGPFQNNIYSSVQNYGIKRNYNGPVRIRKLHIKITDTHGRIIDLQGYPSNFVFEFTCQYSSEKFIKC